ncbi:hypothetical protein MUU49_19285 [Scandinavium goeteborgense]|uniref:hypothetical protein n=1 Tax=Scandinavium goeteborgense TaxID=1851514 RepID=UPI002164F87E|nr:hypothetical protein [Scandinavium goeteborgense]MCS2154701.1 hypothetical protein [Scandinavium goeteborgense]
MKTVIMLATVLLLCSCQATMVSYNVGGHETVCAPVVSVESMGNSVTVSDAGDCKVSKK